MDLDRDSQQVSRPYLLFVIIIIIIIIISIIISSIIAAEMGLLQSYP